MQHKVGYILADGSLEAVIAILSSLTVVVAVMVWTRYVNAELALLELHTDYELFYDSNYY